MSVDYLKILFKFDIHISWSKEEWLMIILTINFVCISGKFIFIWKKKEIELSKITHSFITLLVYDIQLTWAYRELSLGEEVIYEKVTRFLLYSPPESAGFPLAPQREENRFFYAWYWKNCLNVRGGRGRIIPPPPPSTRHCVLIFYSLAKVYQVSTARFRVEVIRIWKNPGPIHMNTSIFDKQNGWKKDISDKITVL